jgi:hypothetical protein
MKSPMTMAPIEEAWPRHRGTGPCPIEFRQNARCESGKPVVDFEPSQTTRGVEPIRSDQEEIMKYICLGYIDEKKWKGIPESEQNALMDECFDYDDELRKNGHFAGNEALQSVRNATTLRWKNGRVSVTDGPYAETKEQLGGILVLEARDLNHAIQLMSKHPGVKAGPFEIRPAEDLTEMIRESERRRSTTRKNRHKEGGAISRMKNHATRLSS